MIHIKIFVFNSFQENTYVLYNEAQEALIIDAGCESTDELAEIKGFIKDQNLKPVALLGTHGHIDHVLGNRDLKEFFKITYKAHEGDAFMIEHAAEQAAMFGMKIRKPPMADSYLTDKEKISFGESSLEVIHLPGHSPGGVGFYCEEQGFIIVGDVLFSKSIGRTDLPGGNYEQLINSINSRLLVLPENTIVYPGHGPETTIGVEKRNNPFLQ